MHGVNSIGYIYYKDKILKIKIIEVHGSYYIVQTEEGEILGIPPESGTPIWGTREACYNYAYNPCTIVPQGE